MKKTLYWCDQCNSPLIAKSCSCGSLGKAIPLHTPYDVRPALSADRELLSRLIGDRFGIIHLPRVVLFNKAGGVDRNDLVIAHGDLFGWLIFDPVSRTHSFEVAPGALPYMITRVTKGIIDITGTVKNSGSKGRIGGKKFPVNTTVPDGPVIVKYGNQYGTGQLKDGFIRVKQVGHVVPVSKQDPSWDEVVEKNRYHLKNLERNAVRSIRQHMMDRPLVNISFSGGKDSTAVLALARKAGVKNAFFLDTGIEFPETLAFIREQQDVEIVEGALDFWGAVEKAGPPGKDHRWCCKLLKLHPLKIYLSRQGPCVTVQGNRWYESWNRADLEVTSQNPHNPLQLNISPIRNWRALEVYMYLWWRGISYNPLYDKGIERIGCYLCPSMLEEEYDCVRSMHPELTVRWDRFLEGWAARKGLPPEYFRWGLWRWKDLPPKMNALCKEHRIRLIESSPGSSAIAVPEKISIEKPIKERPMDEMRKETNVVIKGMPSASPKNDSDKTDSGIRFDDLKKDFRLLSDLIYLDSASTSISPEPVLSAMLEYEHNYRANVGRGVHRLSQIASQRYWHAHEKVSRFIGAKEGVVVFTKNSTEAINMVAQGLIWNRGDRVVTTLLEHHSNILPWMRLKTQGVQLEVAGIKQDYSLDLEGLEKAIDDSTKLVAVTHASNVLGVVTPVPEIAHICHDHGALLLVDGAQSVPHIPVNLLELGCDFFCFSGHKMLGPTGTGVLWMKEPILDPLMVGGGTVVDVSEESFSLATGYERYEAGTPNISGGIGLGAAVDYLTEIGMDRVRTHEEKLTTRMIDALLKIEGLHIYAYPDASARIGVVSFTIEGFDPHEVAHYLDDQADIMVRSGHHCCIPLMKHLGLPQGTVRASLHLYNTDHDVDALVATLRELTGNTAKPQVLERQPDDLSG